MRKTTRLEKPLLCLLVSTDKREGGFGIRTCIQFRSKIGLMFTEAEAHFKEILDNKPSPGEKKSDTRRVGILTGMRSFTMLTTLC